MLAAVGEHNIKHFYYRFSVSTTPWSVSHSKSYFFLNLIIMLDVCLYRFDMASLIYFARDRRERAREMLAMFQLPGNCVPMYFILTAAEEEHSNNTLISRAVDVS